MLQRKLYRRLLSVTLLIKQSKKSRDAVLATCIGNGFELTNLVCYCEASRSCTVALNETWFVAGFNAVYRF